MSVTGSNHPDGAPTRLLSVQGLASLLGAVRGDGYQLVGPTARGGPVGIDLTEEVAAIRVTDGEQAP